MSTRHFFVGLWSAAPVLFLASFLVAGERNCGHSDEQECGCGNGAPPRVVVHVHQVPCESQKCCLHRWWCAAAPPNSAVAESSAILRVPPPVISSQMVIQRQLSQETLQVAPTQSQTIGAFSVVRVPAASIQALPQSAAPQAAPQAAPASAAEKQCCADPAATQRIAELEAQLLRVLTLAETQRAELDKLKQPSN